MMLTADERAAEDNLQQHSAAAAYAEILHIAHRLQPDADVLDIRRPGVVWQGLRQAWHQAGEPDTFAAFADEQLVAVQEEAA